MLPLDAARGTTSERLPLPMGVLLAGLAAIVVAGLAGGIRALEGIRTDDRVEVIAHRGAAAARPENTMAAIERGIEDGADWIEIDVQETADGEVVVFHDSDFMRLAHVDRKILGGHRRRTPRTSTSAAGSTPPTPASGPPPCATRWRRPGAARSW